VEVIDGRTIVSGAITHETTLLELRIDKHMEKIVLNIISTLHHPVILGLPWLEAHNPIIDWQSKTITFNTQHCTSQEPQAQKNTLSSLVKNPMVKNPKRVGTNSSLVKSYGQEPPGGQNQTLSCQESCQESYPENQPCSDLLGWSNTFLSGCQESSSLRHPCQPKQQ